LEIVRRRRWPARTRFKLIGRDNAAGVFKFFL
jgi:hypothetical protein